MSFTIRESIEVLEVDVNLLKSKCETFHDEFFFIKLSFRKHVLTAHPDRGGDPQRFREVYAAWETIKNFYESGNVSDSFISESSLGKKGSLKSSYKYVPPFAEFEDVIGEDMAMYIVQAAKSGIFYQLCIYLFIYLFIYSDNYLFIFFISFL